MRNLLIDAYNFDKSNIKMLRDDSENSLLMPTYENIMRELNDIACSNNDEVWIQYSGHGSQILDSDNTLDDVIVPIDFMKTTYILDHDIHEILLLKIKCNAILIFDCCHSGSIGNLPWSFVMSDNNKNIMTIYNNNNKMTNPNIYLLSGCQDNQTSTDDYNKELSQDIGAFSNAFNECLRDSHHQIDIMTLYKNICINLTANEYSQRPFFHVVSIYQNMFFQDNVKPITKSTQ
jgi:hypothetical protein